MELELLPLSDKGYMANSIAKFVLEHPGITDILEAYNAWTRQERYRDFPWGESWQPVFCIEMFDVCVNKLTPEQLDNIYYDEQKFLLRTYNT